ncbi:MAG TPA: PPK2 family polyphosphate kinase [Thermoleophilaceae bacterium]
MAKALDLEEQFRVAGEEFRLADQDPNHTAGLDKPRAADMRNADLESLKELQKRLYAEHRQALLVVLQGMDASGKDGAIAHVMAGVNPQGVHVTSFKRPSQVESGHDWLWRHVVALPERGDIGVFNRSHYEEVVTVRVHPEYLAPGAVHDVEPPDDAFWQRRFDAITSWERHLVSSGTRVVKFFLHVSKKEQRKRLLDRASDPDKQWKFLPEDVAERAYWDDYQAAYQDALRATSGDEAPWYAIPADHKWFARTAVANIIVRHLEQMDPRFPEVDEHARRTALEVLLEEDAAGGS